MKKLKKLNCIRKISTMMIVFFLFFLSFNTAISTNGSLTWSEDNRLTNTSVNSTQPIVLVEDGKTFVVWVEKHNGRRSIFYTDNSPWLSEWKEPVEIPVEYSSITRLALKKTNNVLHIVWTDTGMMTPYIEYTRSTNEGNTWSEIRVIERGVLSDCAAIDKTVYIAFTPFGAPNFHISTDEGLTWNHKTLKLFGKGITAFNDYVYIVEWERDSISYIKSVDKGETWSNVTVFNNCTIEISSPRVIHKHVAAACYGNNIHLVWSDNRSGHQELYYRRSVDCGDNWSNEGKLTNSIGNSKNPVLAIKGNEINLAWQDDRDGNWEIYYKKSSDSGETWTSDIRLTNDSADSTNPSIAAGDDVYIFWQDNRDGNWEIYYKTTMRENIWFLIIIGVVSVIVAVGVVVYLRRRK